MSRACRFAMVLILFCAGVSTASAQRGIEVERFRPALDADGFFTLQGTTTPGPGRWNVGLWTSWATDPVVLSLSDGSSVDVIAHRVTTDFQLQVGIGGRLGLALDVPLVLFQDTDGQALGDGRGELSATAFGDPRLVARYRILGQDARVYRERNEGGGLAVQVTGSIPAGEEDALAAEHGVTTELAAMADFHVFGAGAGAMLGWRHRFEPRDFVGIRFRDELEMTLALKVPIPVTRDFQGVVEVRGVTDAHAPFADEATTAVEGELGVRITRGDFTVGAGVGTGFTAGVGSPRVRGVLGLWWAPRIHDSDGDQIPDDRDECPFLPEDFDNFEDSDGCLDPDNDNDIIPDVDDLCPNEQAEEFRDEDEDGCTDPFRDGDGDGVEDAADGCPTQVEDRDGFQDDDGCPDPDDDGDGIMDGADACRSEPEDQDGFEDSDGCPDPDNDGDGVLDAADGCPLEAEDVDGFEDADGCPDPDNDRDGVLDADDRCPDGLEVINGVNDGDGCPDRGGRARWRVEGEAGSAAERLVGTIRFGAADAIAATSAPDLDQLARHLIARWPHRFTVAMGSSSAARAAALSEALTVRGVIATRVTVAVDPTLTGGRVVVTRAETGVAVPQANPSGE